MILASWEPGNKSPLNISYTLSSDGHKIRNYVQEYRVDLGSEYDEYSRRVLKCNNDFDEKASVMYIHEKEENEEDII